MSYATIEAAVVTVIIKHADFSTTNCKARDIRPLSEGLERVCLVSYGSQAREELSIRSEKYIWTLNIDVFAPWRGEDNVLQAAINTEMQKVIDTLEAWPKLAATSGVLDSNFTNINKAEPLAEKMGSYRGQRLFFNVQEEVTPTRSE